MPVAARRCPHPHAVALYLDHLAAAGRSMASIELARGALHLNTNPL